MDVTIFKHAKDNGTGKFWNANFADIAGLSEQVVEDKLATQLLFFGKLEDNSRKSPVKVIYRDGLVLDFDHNEVNIVDRIEKALSGYRYTINTTHSNDPDNNDHCLRAVLETSEKIYPQDYENVYWNLINSNPELKKLSDEGFMDHSAKDFNRSFFAPSSHPDRKDKSYRNSYGGMPLKPDTTEFKHPENLSSNSLPKDVKMDELMVGVGEGERHNSCIRIIGLLLKREIPIEWVRQLMLGWNKLCTPPRDEQEVLAEVNDIATRHELKTINDIIQQEPSIEETNEEEELIFTLQNKEQRSKREKPKWYIDRFQRDRGIGAIIGQEYNGKTNWAVDQACRTSRGMDICGHETREPKPVVYVALEDHVGVDLRLNAWDKYHETENNVLLLSEDATFSFTEGEAVVKKFIADCKAQGANEVVIFFDTLQYLIEGWDENTQKDMAIAVKYLKMLVKELNCFVWYLHHMGKDLNKGARGSSLLNASNDSRISVHNNNLIKIEKVKGAKGKIEYSFDTEVIDLGNGDDALVITNTSQSKDKKKELKGPLQIGVWNFIQSQFMFNTDDITQCDQEGIFIASFHKDKLIENVAEFLGANKPESDEVWMKTSWKRKPEAKRIINDLTGKPYNKLGRIISADGIEHIYLQQ